MITLKTTQEDVMQNFPFVQEWIDTVTQKIMKVEEATDIEFFYSYGFFLPKMNPEEKETKYTEMVQGYFEMPFDQRLTLEISKVRIDIIIKIGSTFIMSNRIPKENLSIPKAIKDIATESVKIKMLMESRFHENEDVKNSIPPIDESIIKIKMEEMDGVNGVYNDENEEKFDIDSILDKISKNGIDSLTEDEKELLNNKSEGI
jgi:hypothetical protein